jgi:hypothetical protein
MEYENKHEHEGASKGVAGTALGLSIGALGATLFPGILGNFGGARNGVGDMGAALGVMAALNNGARSGCSEDHCVNRYELGLQNEIAAKDSKIALLESNIYVDSKIADVYERLNGKIGCLEAQMAEQRVYNATLNGTVACIQGQIAQLASLTKLVIPNASVCPGWTTTTTTTP